MADKPIFKPAAAKALKPTASAQAKPVSATGAKKVAAKPATVEPAKLVPLVVPTARAPAKVEMPAKAPLAAALKPVTPEVKPVTAPTPLKGKSPMNETISKAQETATQFANQTADRTQAAFGELNTRAKAAMEKSSKAVEELVEFSKGNIEAVVASSRIAANGAEEIAKYSADYGRTTIEKANATAKQFAAVKSPTEFFQLQSDLAKSSIDAAVAEVSKFSENYLKLLGEIAQPIQNRMAVAVDKVKTSVAA